MSRQAQHRFGERQLVLRRFRRFLEDLGILLPEALDERQVLLPQRAEARLGVELAELVDMVALAAVVAAGELAQVVRFIEIVAPGARIVKMEVRVTHEQLSRLLARHDGQLQRDPLLHAVLFDGAERGVLITVRPRNGIVEAVLAVNAVFHDQAAGSLGILRVQMPAPHQLDQRGILAQLIVAVLIVAAQTGHIPLRNGFECQHGTCYLL